MEGPLSFASGPERTALELGSPKGLPSAMRWFECTTLMRFLKV